MGTESRLYGFQQGRFYEYTRRHLSIKTQAFYDSLSGNRNHSSAKVGYYRQYV